MADDDKKQDEQKSQVGTQGGEQRQQSEPKFTQSDSERNEAHAKATGSTIVGAAGTAVGRGAGEKDNYSRYLEDAMVKATERAAADGITDPDVIKERKAAALKAARDDWPPAKRE